jgi:hypothetical protein
MGSRVAYGRVNKTIKDSRFAKITTKCTCGGNCLGTCVGRDSRAGSLAATTTASQLLHRAVDTSEVSSRDSTVTFSASPTRARIVPVNPTLGTVCETPSSPKRRLLAAADCGSPSSIHTPSRHPRKVVLYDGSPSKIASPKLTRRISQKSSDGNTTSTRTYSIQSSSPIPLKLPILNGQSIITEPKSPEVHRVGPFGNLDPDQKFFDHWGIVIDHSIPRTPFGVCHLSPVDSAYGKSPTGCFPDCVHDCVQDCLSTVEDESVQSPTIAPGLQVFNNPSLKRNESFRISFPGGSKYLDQDDYRMRREKAKMRESQVDYHVKPTPENLHALRILDMPNSELEAHLKQNGTLSHVATGAFTDFAVDQAICTTQAASRTSEVSEVSLNLLPATQLEQVPELVVGRNEKAQPDKIRDTSVAEITQPIKESYSEKQLENWNCISAFSDCSSAQFEDYNCESAFSECSSRDSSVFEFALFTKAKPSPDQLVTTEQKMKNFENRGKSLHWSKDNKSFLLT